MNHNETRRNDLGLAGLIIAGVELVLLIIAYAMPWATIFLASSLCILGVLGLLFSGIGALRAPRMLSLIGLSISVVNLIMVIERLVPVIRFVKIMNYLMQQDLSTLLPKTLQ